jgi:alcohol dehydrogenase class IV
VRFGPLEPPAEPFVLLTTPRFGPPLTEAATEVVHVAPGRVDEVSAALLAVHSFSSDLLLVAYGGGRVIDTTKAIAGAVGAPCAAVPTTLSGAEMTPFHRTPAGVEGARLVRPGVVLADPALMASAPMPGLAASAMNALAHALEALYTPLANPVTTMAALRAATELSAGISASPPDREALALGALLAGYASGSTGIAVHHAVCQTLVRETGTPHAETNAVMLPHSVALMSSRAPEVVADFTRALAPYELTSLAALAGHSRLSTLGVGEQQLPGVARTVAEHPLIANTPQPPGEQELLELLRGAL